MTPEEKICPHVGEPCIGQRCSEFAPRHNFVGGYHWGIQDEFKRLWCLFKRIEYKEKTYVGTSCAHCELGVRSAHRWDKEEFKDPVVRSRL